jgi:hypothetical protein
MRGIVPEQYGVARRKSPQVARNSFGRLQRSAALAFGVQECNIVSIACWRTREVQGNSNMKMAETNAGKATGQKSKPAGRPMGVAGPAEEYGEECGGKGGVPYLIFAHHSNRIARVTVWHRQYVDGIQLETNVGPLPRIGGTGKHRDVQISTFELESDEHITGVSVEYWTYIDRIIFHTNKRNHGPYGGAGGRLNKSLLAPAGRTVLGFKGRHWELVDSIQLMIS